ncbi:MAG: hypothetical protein Q8O55_13570, partial [Dehalococcoidales bacterium]|nr:hypothetical protein [Dehalococcoidales bacterium]
SLSFNGVHFDVKTNSTTQASISLDWGLGGPASLSQPEEVTGLWNFNAASTQFDFIELTGTASITVANTAFNINLGGSGDFVIQDAGTAVFTVNETNLITLNNEITDRTLINGLASVTSDFEVSGIASVSSLTVGGKSPYLVNGTDVSLADGGTGASLTDPNQDRFFMWDDSAGATVLAGLGGPLTFTNTPTLTIASGGIDISNHTNLTGGTDLTLSGDDLILDSTLTQNFIFNATGTAIAVTNLATFGYASVTNDFEVSGTASISAFNLPDKDGGLLGDCENTTDKLVYDSGTKRFNCGVDQSGASGANLGIREGYSAAFANRSSLSFNGVHFDVKTNSTTQASISLDWGLGGPASLSQPEEVTGLWNFN